MRTLQYPDDWSDAACAALDRAEERAEDAEARVAELEGEVRDWKGVNRIYSERILELHALAYPAERTAGSVSGVTYDHGIACPCPACVAQTKGLADLEAAAVADEEREAAAFDQHAWTLIEEKGELRRCPSVHPGEGGRCVYGAGHTIAHHSDGTRRWPNAQRASEAVCVNCGATSEIRLDEVLGKVWVCVGVHGCLERRSRQAGPVLLPAPVCTACGGAGSLNAHNPQDPEERVTCPDCPRHEGAAWFDHIVNMSDDHTGDRAWLRWQLVRAYESGRKSGVVLDKAESVAPSITLDGITYSPGDVRIMRDAARAAEPSSGLDEDLIKSYWIDVYGWDPMGGDEREVECVRRLIQRVRTEKRTDYPEAAFRAGYDAGWDDNDDGVRERVECTGSVYRPKAAIEKWRAQRTDSPIAGKPFATPIPADPPAQNAIYRQCPGCQAFCDCVVGHRAPRTETPKAGG